MKNKKLWIAIGVVAVIAILYFLLSAQQNQLQSKYLALYNQQMLEFYKSGEIK